MRKPPPYASALALAASDPVLLSRAVQGDFHAAREGADPTPNIVAPAVPALVWAGYLRREEGAYEITERGAAVLERQRIGRPRLPAPVQTEIGTGRIWAAPSLQCEEAAPHVQPQPRKLPRNLPAIARLVTEHGFRLEEVPGDPGSLRVIPRRGDGYGTLDFDGHGELVCCAWELSPRREDRCRTMDLVDGVPEGELSRWLQWGRARARDLAACPSRRVDELLRAARLRPGALGTGYIHPADPDAPAVARIDWGAGIVLGLSWLEPWGEEHNRTYPDGATEADVVAWLEPWIERQEEVSAPLMATLLSRIGCDLVYHDQRSIRCADGFLHHEVRRNGAVVTRLCSDRTTWWLLEGQKRRRITPAELVEHLSAPPAPAPEPEACEVEAEVSPPKPASRPRPCRDAVLDLLAKQTLPQQEIHTGHAEGTVKGTLCKLEREGLVERYTAPVVKSGRSYASTWWRLVVKAEVESEAPSLPVICTPGQALEMVRAAGLEPRHVGGWIHRIYDNHGNHVGSISIDDARIRSIYWIGRAALSGEALTVGEIEAWLASRPSPPEAPPAPQPTILSNEPPPLILEVRALAASYGQELAVDLDVTVQRKRGSAASCWKVTTALYKGGRILCRIEVRPDHVVVRGDITDPTLALDRVRAVLEEQLR